MSTVHHTFWSTRVYTIWDNWTQWQHQRKSTKYLRCFTYFNYPKLYKPHCYSKSKFEVYTIWDNWNASKNETCCLVCTSIAICFSYPKLYKLSCFGKCLRYTIHSEAREFIQFGIIEHNGNTSAKALNIYDVSHISIIPNCINLTAIQNQNLKFIQFGIIEMLQKMKHVA